MKIEIILLYKILLTVCKISRDTPASTEINSLLFSIAFFPTIVLRASSNIFGFTVKNMISQLFTTSLLFNVGWAPKSFQKPCVLSVRPETQTLSGFNIPVEKHVSLFYDLNPSYHKLSFSLTKI